MWLHVVSIVSTAYFPVRPILICASLFLTLPRIPGHVDMHKCDFLRVNHAGFTDLFDVRLPGVKDTLACEHECVQWEKGICRSYTYDASERFCYLSHLSHHMVGRNVLDTLDRNLSSGNLDECTYCRFSVLVRTT